MEKKLEKQTTLRDKAAEELNKRKAKAMADVMAEIDRHKAEIKKLEKKLEKIESGEIVSEDSSSDSVCKNIFGVYPSQRIPRESSIVGESYTITNTTPLRIRYL